MKSTKSKEKSNQKKKLSPNRQLKNNTSTIKPFKLISTIRQTFSLLPLSNDSYIIQSQTQYLAKLSQILNILSLRTAQSKKILNSEMIFVSIDPQKQMKQLIYAFNNLTEHKQIVVALWVGVYSRVLDYVVGLIVNKQYKDESEKSYHFLHYLQQDVFDSIQFLLEFQCGFNGFKSDNLPQINNKMLKTSQLLVLKYKWLLQNLTKIIFQQQSKLKLGDKSAIHIDAATINQSSLLVTLASIRQLSSLILRYLPVIIKMVY